MEKIVLLKSLLLLFPAVIFLQSGLDKVFKLDENKTYIRAVFARTFLKPLSDMMFYMLLVIELLIGALAIAGIFLLVFQSQATVGYYTFLLSAVTLTFLLAGQRIARDYVGAAGLVPYLIVAFFGLYLFSI
jgi:hypothetical protein